MNQSIKHLAIIGGGPRGLFALESIFLALYNLQSTARLRVTLFEPFEYPGAGWVWNPAQVDSNWLNITERGLQSLQGRPEIKLGDDIIPSFPSYTEWLPEEQQNPPAAYPDQFPPRAKMGTYLNARFETIAQALIGFELLEIVKETVIKISYDVPQFSIITEHQTITEIDEVVLTIGHQDTELSDQLKEWKEHVAHTKSPILFTEAYPMEDILTADINSDSVIAFRGFGLAMIDQVRALTIKMGGRFEIIDEDIKEVVFHPSDNHPRQFIPFSLDGLPMVPKPFNEAIDNHFKPSNEALEAFAKAVYKGASGEHQTAHHYFLMEAVADVVVPVFQNLRDKAAAHDLSDDELYFLTINYLNENSVEHDVLLSHKTPVLEMMQQQVAMATAQDKITLDYCIGQVWRHCQPTIYKEFSYSHLPDNVVAEVIALDEASKRYSYGPPVESIQQLVALANAGFLTLDFVNNPDIELIKSGWKLEKNSTTVTVNVMLNSVLDAPQLVTVNTDVIKNLLEDELIEPLHTDLGIRTDDYGYVEVPKGKSFVPLAVMGRLSKGSVIGVDAILECFGQRIVSWAEHCISEKY